MANIDQLAYTSLREALEDFEGIASNKRPPAFRKIDKISQYEAYVGTSFIDGNTGTPTWRIGKIVKSANTWNIFYPTLDLNSQGDPSFSFIWDDRATLFAALAPPNPDTGSSSQYPLVEFYADLPLAGSVVIGDIYVVTTPSGVWPINKKYRGLYQTDGVNWNYLGLDPEHSHTEFPPVGGAVGQVLMKNSATNYDFSWQNESASVALHASTHSPDGSDALEGYALCNGFLTDSTVGIPDCIINYDGSTQTIELYSGFFTDRFYLNGITFTFALESATHPDIDGTYYFVYDLVMTQYMCVSNYEPLVQQVIAKIVYDADTQTGVATEILPPACQEKFPPYLGIEKYTTVDAIKDLEDRKSTTQDAIAYAIVLG